MWTVLKGQPDWLEFARKNFPDKGTRADGPKEFPCLVTATTQDVLGGKKILICYVYAADMKLLVDALPKEAAFDHRLDSARGWQTPPNLALGRRVADAPERPASDEKISDEDMLAWMKAVNANLMMLATSIIDVGIIKERQYEAGYNNLVARQDGWSVEARERVVRGKLHQEDVPLGD